MATVQRLFPWKFAKGKEGQSRECVYVREEDMFDALETMREPVFFTGYMGLASEFNSALLTVSVRGQEQGDFAFKVMVTELAKSLLFQLTVFGFAIVSVTKRRMGRGPGFVVARVESAENFTVGFQIQDSSRVYFAKEKAKQSGNKNSIGDAVKQAIIARAANSAGIRMGSVLDDKTNDTVGADPHAEFLIVVSRPPSWDGRLCSSASVIVPVRRDLETRKRIHASQSLNHAFPLVYLRRVPVSIPPAVMGTLGLNQNTHMGAEEVEKRNEIQKTEDEDVTYEDAIQVLMPSRSTKPGNASSTEEASEYRIERPVLHIKSKYELLNGPTPPAPVFPQEQQESYADNVCACLGVPRSYVVSNQSAVQTVEEQSDRDAKLNAHFKAVSEGLEKVLSFAESLKSPEESGSDSELEQDSKDNSRGTAKMEQQEEEEEGEPPKRKKTKLIEKGQILDETSTNSGLLVRVKITLALSIDRVTALIQSGLLKRDRGLQMIAGMLNLQVSDFVTEKEQETKEIRHAKLMAQATESAESPGKPKPQPASSSSSSSSSSAAASSSSKRKADKSNE